MIGPGARPTTGKNGRSLRLLHHRWFHPGHAPHRPPPDRAAAVCSWPKPVRRKPQRAPARSRAAAEFQPTTPCAQRPNRSRHEARTAPPPDTRRAGPRETGRVPSGRCLPGASARLAQHPRVSCARSGSGTPCRAQPAPDWRGPHDRRMCVPARGRGHCERQSRRMHRETGRIIALTFDLVGEQAALLAATLAKSCRVPSL